MACPCHPRCTRNLPPEALTCPPQEASCRIAEEGAVADLGIPCGSQLEGTAMVSLRSQRPRPHKGEKEGQQREQYV